MPKAIDRRRVSITSVSRAPHHAPNTVVGMSRRPSLMLIFRLSA